jgi:hypothetical protein
LTGPSAASGADFIHRDAVPGHLREPIGGASPRNGFRRKQMTDQQETEIGNENRNMWIAVGVIVVLLVGGMGINALVHKEPVSAEASQQGGSSQ